MTKEELSERKGETVMMAVDGVGVFGTLQGDERGLFVHYQKSAPDSDGWGSLDRYYLSDNDINLIVHKGGALRTGIDLVSEGE